MQAPRKQKRLIEQAGHDAKGDRLPAPSGAGRTAMKSHVAEAHGYPDFRVARDVHLGGTRTDSQILTWDPTGERFWCSMPECAGLVFITGEITDEMIERAQRFDPGAQAHLTGIAEQDKREMTRRYLRGEINRETLRRLRGAGPRRRAAAGTRPVVEERYRKVEAWMLERVAELGVFERVLDEAEAMQRDDLDAWRRIAGRTLVRGTLRRYWQHVSARRKKAAYRAFELRQASAREKLT